MTVKQYSLKSISDGMVYVLVAQSGGFNQITQDLLYSWNSLAGLPLVHKITNHSDGGNPRNIDFIIVPDPRCDNFETEFTALLDQWFRTPLAEQKFVFVERAALQDIIDNLSDTDGEQQFVAADIAEDLSYLLDSDPDTDFDGELHS